MRRVPYEKHRNQRHTIEKAKLIFIAALLVLTLVVLGYQLLKSRNDSPYMDGLIIDVRSPGEFAKGHVDGAINIPHNQIKAQISKYAEDKDTEINLYCASGARASYSKKALLDLGYTKVANLKTVAYAKKALKK